MTLAARRILVIGGGFSGMAAAIALRKHGAAVDLVEIDPGWRSYGAGISLGGATLRAFRQLGVLDAFLQQGNASDGVKICLAHGPQVAELPTPRIAGPEVPGGGGIMRPVLARILAEATRAAGVSVMLGCSFSAIAQDAQGVEVTLTDGQRRRYDLVIGADGLYSKTREALFPGAPKPRYSGQAVWRAVLPRPSEVETATMWLGPRVKPGVNPVSKTEMYLFVTEPRPTNERVDPAEFAPLLRAMLEPFTAPVLRAIRERIGADSQIVFRPIEGLLQPRPWSQGRVVLIGDAVHATTPHLASGACIGIEDALVLADELHRDADVTAALAAFETRRWERCRMVVENSARLGEIEIANGDKDEHARIMRESLMALAQPIWKEPAMATTSSKRGRAALMVAHCAGMVDLVALPVWVGTLISRYGFGPQQAGLLATLFLLSAVLASVVTASRFQRLVGRAVAVVGFGIAAVAFGLASTQQAMGPLALLHALAGLGAGMALSVTHGTIARSANPHRLFALVGIALGFFAVVFLAATPQLVAAFGGPVLFLVFGGVMAVAVLAAAIGFPVPDAPAQPAAGTAPVQPIPRVVWFGIVGIAGMALSQAMTFSFLERVGMDRGFGAAAVSGVLIALGLVNLCPSVLAALLEKRLEPRKVLIAGALLQAAFVAVIMNSTVFAPYAAAASVFAGVIIFSHTFAFGLLARLEPSGRALAATPAMMMIGGAIGPVLGGTLVKAAGYAGISIAAAVIAAVSISCFIRLPAPAARGAAGRAGVTLNVLVTGAGGFVGRALLARLQSDGHVGGRAIGRLTQLDVALGDAAGGDGGHRVQGSIADPAVVARAFAEPVHLLVHLASVPGGAAEQQPAVAREVNLHGTLHLLDACERQVAAGGPLPRAVFASTIAVFGAAMPAVVDDDTPARPAMAYGAHKLMGEIALADATRRGACDGLSLRLSGVLARPPARTGQLSAFLSDLLRDPAAGRDVVCPMSPGATTWAASTPNVVDNLLHAAAVDTASLQSHRALTLPALRFSMAELLDALAAVHGPRVREHVRFEPEPRIEALFGRFPPLRTPMADAAGFRHDGDLPALCRHAIDP